MNTRVNAALKGNKDFLDNVLHDIDILTAEPTAFVTLLLLKANQTTRAFLFNDLKAN